jgi:hypothetical protein
LSGVRFASLGGHEQALVVLSAYEDDAEIQSWGMETLANLILHNRGRDNPALDMQAFEARTSDMVRARWKPHGDLVVIEDRCFPRYPLLISI